MSSLCSENKRPLKALFLARDSVKVLVTIHEPTESLRQAHFAKLGVDSHHREIFNQKDGLPEQLQVLNLSYEFTTFYYSDCSSCGSLFLAGKKGCG